MFSVKWIKNNKNIFDASIKKRKELFFLEKFTACQDKKISDVIENLYQEVLILKKEIEKYNCKKKRGKNTDEEKFCIKNIKKNYEEKKNMLNNILFNCPNIISSDIAEEDVVICEVGVKLHEKVLPHYNTCLGISNYTSSGSRFIALSNACAVLERALMNFMIESHIKRNYVEVSLPYMVNEEAMFGSGQFPKFKKDAFRCHNGKWLIPTGEVSVINMFREEKISKENLPIKIVTHSPCFRSEAGSAGKDKKGLIRLHQFNKVELIHITQCEKSEEEFSYIQNSVENILKELNLPYRKLIIGSKNLGFTAFKQIDFEVWMPGEKRYLEVSSCSNCLDFQSKRINCKVKESNEYVHTLNASGLAIGRTIAAIIENYQEGGKIRIPEKLKKYIVNVYSSEYLKKINLLY